MSEPQPPNGHPNGQPPQPPDWRLLKFLARNCLTGIICGWAVLLGFLWTDVGNIGTLTESGSSGALGMFLLAVMFGLTGGSVAMGIAVMTLARKDP
ncbi:MAG: hypothetical protein ACFCUS_11960 [Rubrimonas sp.]|uniref:hypothetical protein n=1 Tax=Rubrimonas sp. TaxID=2036015 RepID=UPI002FDCF325